MNGLPWQAGFPTTIYAFNGHTYDLTRPYIAPDGSIWRWTRWCTEHRRPVATRSGHTPGDPAASAEIRELIAGHAYRYLARPNTTQGTPSWKQ
ncbi:phiSA1p31-related protein [Streptomyces sp. NBC_01304]|uniref:phiSA1p31-related protein n=1 Tax=Streptomyces sp. NBC_01304 TaxID=2903818 RepID=UPI002E11C8A6|nr:phiSA1p31-related protein [Streptomyces sp. NBC_01304]